MRPAIFPSPSRQGAAAHLIQRTVPSAVLDRLAAGAFAASGEAATVHRQPGFGQLWKDVVMTTTDGRTIKLVLSQPTFAGRDVVHLSVEHRHRDRCMSEQWVERYFDVPPSVQILAYPMVRTLGSNQETPLRIKIRRPYLYFT